MLAGFEAAKAYVKRASLDRCLAAGAREQSMLRMLLNADAQHAALQHRVIQAYRATELDLAWTDREVQTQALRLLLRGETTAAHDVGMDPERRHHCLAVDVMSGREAREVESALSYTEGVFGTVDGYFCGVVRWEPKPTDLDH
nr:hypothetical protein [Micromonospora sp. DSM 115978]